MKPDRTAPKEQSDLAPYCLQYRLAGEKADAIYCFVCLI